MALLARRNTRVLSTSQHLQTIARNIYLYVRAAKTSFRRATVLSVITLVGIAPLPLAIDAEERTVPTSILVITLDTKRDAGSTAHPNALRLQLLVDFRGCRRRQIRRRPEIISLGGMSWLLMVIQPKLGS